MWLSKMLWFDHTSVEIIRQKLIEFKCHNALFIWTNTTLVLLYLMAESLQQKR